ncbi:DUF5026 domain-containing protein [Blautia obeum]|uniref:DUF5026 domain-containing protein n=1 Tax=Blautia obeum TaxID=40520 RepID=UPI0032193AE2
MNVCKVPDMCKDMEYKYITEDSKTRVSLISAKNKTWDKAQSGIVTEATVDTITVLFLPETQNIQNHFVIQAEAIEKGMWTIRYSSDGMETVNVYEGSVEDGSESVAV